KEPALAARFRAAGREFGLLIGADAPLGDNLYARVEGEGDVRLLGRGIRSVLDRPLPDLRDRTVLEFEIPDVDRLEIARDGERLELAREEGAWRIARPVSGLADADRINAVLRKVRYLRVREFTDDAPKDPAAYGLDRPRAELTIRSGRDGAPHVLQIGAAAPEGALYARRGGHEGVFTVGVDALEDLTPAPGDLRERAVTRLAPASIEGLRIRRGGESVALAKSGAQWRIAEPEPAAADAETVGALLGALTGLKVEEFVADRTDSPSRYGLAEGTTEITLTPAAGDAETLLVGSTFDRGRKAYLKRGGGDEILAVPASPLAACATEPIAFLDRQVLDFDPGDVLKISIAAVGRPAVIIEKGEGGLWRVVEPDAAEADPAAVDAVISNLSRLRALELVEREPNDLRRYGLDAPAVRASIGLKRGEAVETRVLLVGKKTKDGAPYAMLGDGALVFTVPSYVEANLRRDPAVPAPPE
ncbi:MAG: DUF4340 domain-containing protein, partial [bacterium]|nr:DUF4340 domain-containing protein [bacterium]